MCHHRALYQIIVVSSPIPEKFVCHTSITSAYILANTPLTHVTYFSNACILIIALKCPLYACHFNHQCLYSSQYLRIYAIRPLGEYLQSG